MVALLDDLRRAWHGEMIPENSPVGDSQSNGAAEKAIQTFGAQLRTMKLALEEKIQVAMPVGHPLMIWLAHHTG